MGWSGWSSCSLQGPSNQSKLVDTSQKPVGVIHPVINSHQKSRHCHISIKFLPHVRNEFPDCLSKLLPQWDCHVTHPASRMREPKSSPITAIWLHELLTSLSVRAEKEVLMLSEHCHSEPPAHRVMFLQQRRVTHATPTCSSLKFTISLI